MSGNRKADSKAMAKEYSLEILGQPTVYGSEPRNIQMYFAEPEEEANKDTGILLLIAGYGGSAKSNVYQKMRKQFADTYNLVTVQCDYLGSSFMQDNQHMPVTEEVLRSALSDEEINLLLKDYQGNQNLLMGKTLTGYVPIGESGKDYNEMGLLQAMDNLMAVKVLSDILKENGITGRRDRIYIYGQSHGAYLAYLCNFLAPGLFSAVIDNSAYLVPHYLFRDREVVKEGEIFNLRKIYHYMIRDMEYDRDSYDLEKLYDGFFNQAEIIVYHGADDEMIPLADKKRFLEKIKGVSLHEITKEQVDGKAFYSSSHGLGADFLEVFHMAMRELAGKEAGKNKEDVIEEQEIWENKSFHTGNFIYEVKWDTNIPILSYTKQI